MHGGFREWICILMVTQTSFNFDDKETMQGRFNLFHSKNPGVYNKFCDYALQAGSKRKRYSARFIVGLIRWNEDIETEDKTSVFKINDHFARFYGQMFEKQYPQYKGLFERRSSE